MRSKFLAAFGVVFLGCLSSFSAEPPRLVVIPSLKLPPPIAQEKNEKNLPQKKTKLGQLFAAPQLL